MSLIIEIQNHFEEFWISFHQVTELIYSRSDKLFSHSGTVMILVMHPTP